MPRIPIPEYQRRDPGTGLGPTPRANIAPSPDFEGGALTNLGRALAQLGDAGVLHAADFKAKEDKTRADDAYVNGFGPQFRDLYNGYYNLQGKDALDQRPDFEKRMLELRTNVRETLGNDDQKRLFDTISRSRLEGELDSMARHAATQRRVWITQTHDATLDNLITAAADKSNDDRAFGSALQTGMAEIDRFGTENGQSAEVMRAKSAAFVSKAWTQRIDRLSIFDPVGAQALYTAHAPEIVPPERIALERKIKAAVTPVLVKKAADEIMAPQDLQQLQMNGYVNVVERAPGAEGSVAAASPTTVRDTRAMLATWISAGEKRAEEIFPGDPVAKDMLLAAIKGRVGTIVQMQEGVQRKAQGDLINFIVERRPGSIEAVLANPDARQAWTLLDPASKQAIVALAEREGPGGDKIKTNPAVFREVYNRIHAKDSDPNKITSDTQLVPFMGQGLSYDDLQRMRSELQRAQTPEGNAFLKDVQTARNVAHRMLRGSIMGSVQPEVAEDAAYRFGRDLDAKIDEYRKAGKDPRQLLTPGTPDYALDPKRVATFMPGATEAMRDSATKVKAASPQAARGEIGVAPTINDEAGYNALPKGAKYVDGRDGKLKVKS